MLELRKIYTNSLFRFLCKEYLFFDTLCLLCVFCGSHQHRICFRAVSIGDCNFCFHRYIEKHSCIEQLDTMFESFFVSIIYGIELIVLTSVYKLFDYSLTILLAKEKKNLTIFYVVEVSLFSEESVANL